MRIGKVRLTWPFSLVKAETPQDQNDRAAIGILARAVVSAAETLEQLAEQIRNGQATPMMSQRAKLAATAGRSTLEQLGITRRAPTPQGKRTA